MDYIHMSITCSMTHHILQITLNDFHCKVYSFPWKRNLKYILYILTHAGKFYRAEDILVWV